MNELTIWIKHSTVFSYFVNKYLCSRYLPVSHNCNPRSSFQKRNTESFLLSANPRSPSEGSMRHYLKCMLSGPWGKLAQWLTYCQLICVNVQASLNPRTDLFSAVTSIWSSSMEESWSFASRGEAQWCIPQALTADLNSCLYWKWLFFLLPDKASRKQTTGFKEHLHEWKHGAAEKELIDFWVTISYMSLSAYTDT